jgi:tRNA threonylcarbamoyladenosine biosynthesis protein TsaB
MNTLFVDTHDFIHIALFNKDNLINEEYIYNLKDNSTILLDTIIKVIDNNKVDNILVVNGPGSFTGVRLGIVFSKTYAYTKNIPIRVISYLELMKLMTNSETVAFKDNKGYYISDSNNNNLYLSNKEYELYKDNTLVTEDFTFNYKLLINYIDTTTSINPHDVNPLYIKKIDALK